MVAPAAWDECWLWAASLRPNGYGQFSDGVHVGYAHRWSWQYFRGYLPDGLVIDHLCGERRCVNPEHLSPVSWKHNINRGRIAAGLRPV